MYHPCQEYASPSTHSVQYPEALHTLIVVNLVTAKAMWVHFATVTVHPSQLRIWGYPGVHDMNIIKICCFH